DDRMDDLGRQDRKGAVHGIEYETGLIGGGGGACPLERVLRVLRRELAAIGKNAGEYLGMKRHYQVENALVALGFLVAPGSLTLFALAYPFGMRGEIPGEHADEGGKYRAQRADDRIDALGIHVQLRLSRGSSASRSPSPMRLMASTVMRIARPGKAMIHGWAVMNSRASASMAPHSGMG